MKDTTSILIIGLVVAFGIGFFVGHDRQEPAYPVNYNPQQAAASDAVKVSQESNKLCYDLIAQQLQHPTICPKETTH